MNHAFEVIKRLSGKTLATAESCTGGGIGAALTAVPGSSAVYKGGIISYTNEVKHRILGVREELLEQDGAVSPGAAGGMGIPWELFLSAMKMPGTERFIHSASKVTGTRFAPRRSKRRCC